jgi:hypothetical protein
MKALQLGGKLTCNTTDCANGLHCFNRAQAFARSRKGKPHTTPGVCGTCGTDPGFDWSRLHRCDPADAPYKVEAMRQEYIRDYFWQHPFTERVVQHALRKGRVQLYKEIPKRISSAIGNWQHPAEGRQTPVGDARLGNVVQYAQHSVAACCRKCVEKWHGIEIGRALTTGEVAYISGLVRLFLDSRLPDLPDGPTSVPRKRR